jgi:hypothetical protein
MAKPKVRKKAKRPVKKTTPRKVAKAKSAKEVNGAKKFTVKG